VGAAPEGPRENPILVVPLLIDPATRTPDVDAGGRAPPGTAGATVGERVSPGAPEVLAPEVLASAPEEVTRELVQPDAPEAATPAAWASGPEVAAGGQARPGAPEATAPEAPPGPSAAESCAPNLGQLHLNLEALRKRKGPPSCSGDAYRSLK
jgi:hypothetical protein